MSRDSFVSLIKNKYMHFGCGNKLVKNLERKKNFWKQLDDQRFSPPQEYVI
jgi:hypothetical protein